MRRNDFDITDKIRTTDPIEVCDEVVRLYRGLYSDGNSRPIKRAFEDMSTLYHGKHPDYHPCDTEYHDIQHVLDVTLAMGRLLDGFGRTRKGHAPLPPAYFSVGIITALFHDVGYLRRRNDRKHRYGAEYTLTHVTRGSHFLRDYLPRIGLKRYALDASKIVHFTGYEHDPDSIHVDDPVLRRIGEILGTADILAQMSDRCYLEKCRDRLYPEFLLGGLARRRLPNGRIVTVYKSGNDLVRRTPAFYANAMKRLEQKLHRAYVYAEKHFDGQNLYMMEMNKNAAHAGAAVSSSGRGKLRRAAPRTLLSGVRAYPETLRIP
jgi:hypothetical protein